MPAFIASLTGVDILRVLNIAAWSALFFYMLPGAWSAISQRNVRYGDAMRLGVAAVCLLRIIWSALALFDLTEATLPALHIASIGVCGFIFWLARSYGRGKHVG